MIEDLQNMPKEIVIDRSKPTVEEQEKEKTFDELIQKMFTVKGNIKEWIKQNGRNIDEQLDLYAIFVREYTAEEVRDNLKSEYAAHILKLHGLI